MRGYREGYTEVVKRGYREGRLKRGLQRLVVIEVIER